MCSLPANQVIYGEGAMEPMHPVCCGAFQLAYSNACLRPSCRSAAVKSRFCPQFLAAICVCKGDLVYNECTLECISPHQCPPLFELLACPEQPDPYDHCDRMGESASGAAFGVKQTGAKLKTNRRNREANKSNCRRSRIDHIRSSVLAHQKLF